MKKFRVTLSELIHYDEHTVEAENKDNALEVFRLDIEDGKIQIQNIETAHCDIKEKEND